GALTEIARTPQRRDWLAPWRFLRMLRVSRYAVPAIVVAAVLLIAGGSVYLAGQHSNGATAPPPPTAAAPSPSALGSPIATNKYGLNVGPGVKADGTIVFGLHDEDTDTDALYAIAPDGSDAAILPAAGGCCLTLPPDGRAVMVGEDVAGRTV